MVYRDRGLLREVQLVRAMIHDNVLKFLKATIAVNHVAMLYETVGRGTVTVSAF